MSDSNYYNTPILLLAFNRPDTTAKVLEVLRRIKPKLIYVAADGPRPGNVDDQKKCEQTRNIIEDAIDWSCEKHFDFREINLGCGKAVSEAITWFFKNVEYGIILEDDTVPNLDFFDNTEKLLIKYKEDEDIFHISGNSFFSFENLKATDSSYYFSKFPFIWGWATWRRAWEKYDYDLLKTSHPSEVKFWLEQNFTDEKIRKYWLNVFLTIAPKPNGFTWDYQWFFTIWKQNAFAILPGVNTVTNIGWNSEATHTVEENHQLSSLKVFPLEINTSETIEKKVGEFIEIVNFKNYYLNEDNQVALVESRAIPAKSLKSRVKIKIGKYLVALLPQIGLLKNRVDVLENSHLANSVISELSKIHGKSSIIDSSVNDYSYVAPNAFIFNSSIGKFCSIGPNLNCGYGIHPLNGISTSPMFYSTKRQNGFTLTNVDKVKETLPVTIGNDVFIGINVTILDGVSIGNGAVIGAGAVVSSDIPDYAIAVGVPAKVVRFRFEAETIRKLLDRKWWNDSFEDLQKVESDFWDVKQFLKV